MGEREIGREIGRERGEKTEPKKETKKSMEISGVDRRKNDQPLEKERFFGRQRRWQEQQV